MKKIAYLLIPVLMLVFTSCENKEAEVYSGESITYFSETSVSYAVEPGSSKSIELVVTDASSSDRSYTIEVDQAMTTALADSYSLDTAFSIPAGEYTSTFNVYGVVENVVAGQKLVLKLTSVEGSSPAGFDTTVTLTMSPSCPVEADFTGEYLIEEITPYVDGPSFNDGSIVTVSLVAGQNTQRSFVTATFPAYCPTTTDTITFDLNCGQILMAGDGSQASCSCGGNYFFTTAPTPSTYDPSDDSTFDLTFTNDAFSDCGSTAVSTYRFTKQ